MKATETWEKMRAGNFVLNRDGYFISYNPSPEINMEGRGETALCFNGKFFILNGSHKEEYEQCGSLQECADYYKAHIEEIAFWSNGPEIDEAIKSILPNDLKSGQGKIK